MGSFYRSQHELVFVFRNGAESHRNNVQLGRFGRNRTNVWHYPGVNTLAATRIKWISPLIKRSCAISSINWDEMATIECLPAAHSVPSDVKDAMTTE
jgi:hypothetical protein